MLKTLSIASVAAFTQANLIGDLLSEGYSTGRVKVHAVSNSGKGVDFSTSLSLSSAQCLHNDGYTTVIPRAWHSSGTVDTAACGSLNNAKSAGIPNRDVYFFPCPTCSASASTQLNSMVNYLKANCASSWSTMIWLDIEGSQYWTGNYTNNKTWYESLVNACATLHSAGTARCGVYASTYQWSSIFGSSSWCYGASTTPQIWYAHYDGVANFNDWTPFGCWTTPWAKQY